MLNQYPIRFVKFSLCSTGSKAVWIAHSPNYLPLFPRVRFNFKINSMVKPSHKYEFRLFIELILKKKIGQFDLCVCCVYHFAWIFYPLYRCYLRFDSAVSLPSQSEEKNHQRWYEFENVRVAKCQFRLSGWWFFPIFEPLKPNCTSEKSKSK